MFETKMNNNFVWAYTFYEVQYKIEKDASIQNSWKMVVSMERYVYIWSRGTEYLRL